MTPKKYLILTCLLFLTSGCSLMGGGTKTVEVVSKPIELDIMQPALPRPIEMTSPKWYVVSEAVITNPCVRSISFDPPKFDENGVEKLKRPKLCDLADRENPDWPEGYTYLDRFLDEMKKQNNGDVVFVATTIGDYEVMSGNMQEINRYIKQMGQVIVYYREVTNADKNTQTEAKDD